MKYFLISCLLRTKRRINDLLPIAFLGTLAFWAGGVLLGIVLESLVGTILAVIIAIIICVVGCGWCALCLYVDCSVWYDYDFCPTCDIVVEKYTKCPRCDGRVPKRSLSDIHSEDFWMGEIFLRQQEKAREQLQQKENVT